MSGEVVSDRELGWIHQIDQVRGVIQLGVAELHRDRGLDDDELACVLELANQELQRLRDAIDAAQTALNYERRHGGR